MPCGRRDVGVACQTLHDVDVLSPADEARGVSVTSPVWVMPPGHARRSAGLEDEVVRRPSSVGTEQGCNIEEISSAHTSTRPTNGSWHTSTTIVS